MCQWGLRLMFGGKEKIIIIYRPGRLWSFFFVLIAELCFPFPMALPQLQSVEWLSAGNYHLIEFHSVLQPPLDSDPLCSSSRIRFGEILEYHMAGYQRIFQRGVVIFHKNILLLFTYFFWSFSNESSTHLDVDPVQTSWKWLLMPRRGGELGREIEPVEVKGFLLEEQRMMIWIRERLIAFPFLYNEEEFTSRQLEEELRSSDFSPDIANPK
jgi:hypothetical protein